MTQYADTVDLGALAAAVRRGWRHVLVATLLALAAAVAVLLYAPRRFEGSASVLVRGTQDLGGSLLARMGGLTDLAPGGLGEGLKSTLETELQLLASRDVLGSAVDSLGLQARVTSPLRLATPRVVSAVRVGGSFKRLKLTFERQPDGGYRMTSREGTARAQPGVPVPVLGGTLTIARGPLPDRFVVELEDHDDAVTRLAEHLSIDKKGGDVAGIGYAGGDSLRAAWVPNRIIAEYLDRRKTVDRGVNVRRLEFLRVEADSISRALAQAEESLRREQERSGVLDPELAGRVGVESGRTVREQLGAVEVEQHALGQLLEDVGAGKLSPRQLVAYPSFLRSEAINSLLTQISTLETERLRLLERRTEADPDVIVLASTIRNLEQQLLPLGRAYAGALDRQHATLAGQYATIGDQLSSLPQYAEQNIRLVREVKRLGQTMLALQTQLLDAELAAIGEGGQVRQIDRANPPKRPAFPRPLPTLLIGLVGGLLLGVTSALLRATLGRSVEGEAEIERATGIPVVRLDPDAPLLVSRLRPGRAVLVVPVDPTVDAVAVAVRLAAPEGDAVAPDADDGRVGQDVQLLDVREAGLASSAAVRRTLDALEAQGASVVAALPPVADPRTTPLLATQRPVVLVAPDGRVDRRALLRLIRGLHAVDAPVAGIVLAGPTASGAAPPAHRNGRGRPGAVPPRGGLASPDRGAPVDLRR